MFGGERSGPQHPASHGVLVCILYMCNEYIVFNDVQIGYLHRGSEKLIEFKTVARRCLILIVLIIVVVLIMNMYLLCL